MKNRLMTHVVAGYPNEKECIELLLKMQEIGVDVVEVQIPFSDPIADGETIMLANDKVLENGMTVKKSFDLIKNARKADLKIDIYIMSYVQKLLSFGIEQFCREAASVRAEGFIIPDLPVGTEEHEFLKKFAEEYNLEIVPVVSPGMDKHRLEKDLELAKNLVYLTSIKGITGGGLKLSDSLRQTAKEIKRQKPDCNLAVGFGIKNKDDVSKVLSMADTAVVGSSVIHKINETGVNGAIKFLSTLL